MLYYIHQQRKEGISLKMKEKLASFFYGRYGTDALGKFALVLYMLLAVVMLFIKLPIAVIILQIASWLLFVFIFYRMLSRNIPRRMAENQKFLKITRPMREALLLQKNKWKYRKTHIYRKCPHCRVQIRLKRLSGEHACKCPKCGKVFSVKLK